MQVKRGILLLEGAKKLFTNPEEGAGKLVEYTVNENDPNIATSVHLVKGHQHIGEIIHIENNIHPLKEPTKEDLERRSMIRDRYRSRPTQEELEATGNYETTTLGELIQKKLNQSPESP